MSSAAQNLTQEPMASVPGKIGTVTSLQGVFTADSYQIAQPFFQVFKEGYQIVSVDQRELYSAVRHRSHFKNLVSKVGAWLTAMAVFGFGIVGFIALMALVSGGSVLLKQVFGLVLGVGVLLVLPVVVYVVVLRALAPKRKTSLTKGAEEGPEVLSIQPASGVFFFSPTYHIVDQNGKPLATFRKHFFESLFRKHWHCHDANEKYLFSAVEDSLLMALLRRFMFFGKFIPLQFSFAKGRGKKFGEFKRR